MRQRVLGFVVLAAVMSAITLFAMHTPGICQEETAKGDAAKAAKPKAMPPASAKAKPPASAKTKTFRGRLPAYYKDVVDSEQRKKVYAIQLEFAPKIDALKAELRELVKDRNAKVAAVLTPEQQDKIQQLREEAKAKRAAKRKKGA